MLRGQQQSLVVGRADRLDARDRAVVLPLRRIELRQQPPLIGRRRRCAGAVNRRIRLIADGQAMAAALEVVRRYHPCGTDLPLNADIPLIEVRWPRSEEHTSELQ